MDPEKSHIERIPLEILTKIFGICRDDVWDEDENPKSILDPGVAPMLLGHVCPLFRATALQTPLIWDIVTFTTDDVVSRFPAVQTVLARSGRLPLTLHLSTAFKGGPGTAQFLQRLWEFHPRFQHLSFLFSCDDVQPDSLPAPTTLQLLRSIDISVIDTCECFPAFLHVFRDAPLLRSLTLDNPGPVDAMSHIFRLDFFPWHQLTELTSSMSVTTTTALDILRHCPRLEICRLRDLEPVDVLHQPPLCILNEMRTLDLSADSDLPFIGFFDSLAFPLLNKLILQCFSVRGDSLLGLQRRSQSPIHFLAIESLRLTADEIIQLLHLMPSLETFFVTYSHCAGNIFAALTYRGDPTLVLPNLHQLAVQEDSGLLSWMTDADDGADGVAVVEMAESLEQYPGPLNICLPSIRSVELHLVGPKFSPALEARLAAACTTGCVVDHCVDERY